MKGKLSWPVFWALIGVFIVIACIFSIPVLRELIMGFLFIMVSGAILLLLSVALIILTVREKVEGMLKKFLILTGASPVGLFVSILLHNAIYGLLIYWFGTDFWERTGIGDEPFFFFMAIGVCPLGFIVGVVGSIVLAIREIRQQNKTIAEVKSIESNL